MIKAYEEFILEKDIYDLILESKVYLSEKFKEILQKIESPIAKVILDAEGEDKPVRDNWFDVVDKETLSFIADAKALKLAEDDKKEYVYYFNGVLVNLDWKFLKSQIRDSDLKKIEAILLEYVQPEEVAKCIADDDEVQEFKNKPGELVGRVDMVNDEVDLLVLKFGDKFVIRNSRSVIPKKAVWIKNRQTIRVGRAVRAMLTAITNKKFTDADIEDFVNQFKSTYDWFNDAFRNFRIVEGHDIDHYYFYTSYAANNGTLGNSCMKEKSSEYFEIYSLNPEVCKLVILNSSTATSGIVGRALLWTLVDGRKFLDRIYTSKDEDILLFRKYAAKNGWLYKEQNNSNSYTSIVTPPEETGKELTLKVNIKALAYEKYPYVDTLKYMTEYDDYIMLTNDGTGAQWVLESTQGFRHENICMCENTRIITCTRCHGETEISIDCIECYAAGRIRCGECSGEGYDEETDQKCSKCEGDRFVDCLNCDATGRVLVECPDCAGSGEQDCPRCY
jgi:hypothetical protein